MGSVIWSSKHRYSHNLELSAFYGGDERGPCLQLAGEVPANRGSGYVQMTLDEAWDLAHGIIKHVEKEMRNERSKGG